jgi:acyl dehydratase
MVTIQSPSEIQNYIDKPLTPSEWYHVTQEKINKFADATSDHQWIHVDEERAKKEMPDGKTIAHGYYMVSLLPKLAAQNAEIKNTSRTLNYGSDKVRFINMVKVGSYVRLNRTIISCEEMKNGGFRVVNRCELEIKDESKPAFVAETISLHFPKN